MSYYGTIVGKKSISENLIGEMHTHDTQYIPYPAYEGSYEATPTQSLQTFTTNDKRMTENFRVKATPYAEVSNTFGGKTAVIL